VALSILNPPQSHLAMFSPMPGIADAKRKIS
jgi:hypothetical protein